jgi:hypothetical protein
LKVDPPTYAISNPTITVSVGQQNVYTPVLPPIIDCQQLIGKTISNLDFSLTSETGAPVNTNGETWSFIVTFILTF